MLQAAGWTVVPFDPDGSLSALDGCAIEEHPTSNGPADHALCVKGQIQGIVEAKKVSLGPKNVLTQAERYSKGVVGSELNFHGYRASPLRNMGPPVLSKMRPPASRVSWSHFKRSWHFLCWRSGFISSALSRENTIFLGQRQDRGLSVRCDSRVVSHGWPSFGEHTYVLSGER